MCPGLRSSFFQGKLNGFHWHEGQTELAVEAPTHFTCAEYQMAGGLSFLPSHFSGHPRD